MKIGRKNKKNREQNKISDNFEKIEKSHFRSPEVDFGWIWGGILATFADLTVCPSRPERCRRPPRAATATASGAAGRGVGSLRASRRCKICPRDLPAPCGWVGAGLGSSLAAMRAKGKKLVFLKKRDYTGGFGSQPHIVKHFRSQSSFCSFSAANWSRV